MSDRPSDQRVEHRLDALYSRMEQEELPAGLANLTVDDFAPPQRPWRFRPIVLGSLTFAAAAAVVIAGLAVHNAHVTSAPASTPTPTSVAPTPSLIPILPVITPPATPGSTPAATPNPTSGWTTLSNPAGAYSFRYPAAWQVSGPCSSRQVPTDPPDEQVLVGPSAFGCGASMIVGAGGVHINSISSTHGLLLQQSQYPGCTLTNEAVVADGIRGTRQIVSACGGTHFVRYVFVTGGRGYMIDLDVAANPKISPSTVELLVTATFHFHS